MSNIESISDKLRRWADEGESHCMFPAINAARETGCTSGATPKGEAELFRHISDEIDREMNELCESFANPRYVSAEDAVREVALGKCNHGTLRLAIERWYNPKPIDNHDEPIDIGQAVDDKVRGELEVSRVCYTRNGFYFNNSRDGSKRKKMKGITYKHGERVGRPKQQVLDANDVPIEVGDAVWNLSDSTKWEVEKIHSTEPRISIRQLDTDKDVTGGWFLASNYSHREPDTQERIDMDAQEFSHDYWKCYGYACSKCPAMFDGKIPSEHYGVSSCLEAQKLDLLRRQRELDGRDA